LLQEKNNLIEIYALDLKELIVDFFEKQI